MLHVHLHLRACVGGMCGRREVTRKTLAETRTVRKKIQHRTYKFIFCSKAFLRKALHCAGEGVTTKVPLGQLPPILPVHHSFAAMCSTTTSTGFVGEGGFLFFKRDACMHNTSHRIMQ